MNVAEKAKQTSQNIDDAVTVYLRRTGTTQAELASRIPLSEQQFSRKRKGEADWKVTEFFELCFQIGKDPRELLTT